MNTTFAQAFNSSQRSSATESCDAELVQRIVTVLARRFGVTMIKEVHVNANGGVVTLYGWLPSQRDCALCCSCVSHTAGVLRVVDALQVGSSEAAATNTPRTSGAVENCPS